MQSLLNVLIFIWHHPLNRHRRLAALGRFVRWQFASRLFPGALAFPFVENTMLLARNGMTGATSNYYCGLQEYEEMAFVLHVLRPHDLFIDVGANVGSYSVLAAGVAGANVIAIEPVIETFDWLCRNIDFNKLRDKVQVLNVGLADCVGELLFSSDQGTMNHVLSKKERIDGRSASRVKVIRLDDASADQCPTLIKIDVEGYEQAVLAGGTRTLNACALLAVIMETNDCCSRYNVNKDELGTIMRDYGFIPYRYEPRKRVLSEGIINNDGNTLFVRDCNAVKQRFESAPRVSINGQQI